MNAFAKTVLSGFAFSLGAALFRKVAPKLGLDDKSDGKKDAARAAADDGADGSEADGDRRPPLAQRADAAIAWLRAANAANKASTGPR